MLHLGDCLDVMRGFDAECIDLTVTSPPYDNLRTYNGSLNDWTEAKWKAIIAELYRVTKQGGVVVWVVGDATVNGSETGTSFRQALHAMECGFRLHDTMVWNKSKMPQSHNRYEQHFEYMFVFAKGRPQTFNGIADKVNTHAGQVAHCTFRDVDGTTKKTSSYKQKNIAPLGLRGNVWALPGVMSSTERCGHPAPFPEALARDHVLSWSNEGDTVFDPFTGSGTTGKMALAHGRKFIGIERDPQYFEIARKRIADAAPTQGAFFMEAAE